MTYTNFPVSTRISVAGQPVKEVWGEEIAHEAFGCGTTTVTPTDRMIDTLTALWTAHNATKIVLDFEGAPSKSGGFPVGAFFIQFSPETGFTLEGETLTAAGLHHILTAHYEVAA